MSETTEKATEADALKNVLVALEGVDQDTRSRILEYAAKSYGIDLLFAPPYFVQPTPAAKPSGTDVPTLEHVASPNAATAPSELDGVNEIGVKWITRNAIDPTKLAPIFSLNGDEIDVIAKAIPGKKMKERFHQVLLLKGIASYLSSGTPKVEHEALRETSEHYEAYDQTNFARNIESFSSEISGSKESGYTLNQRGLAAAAELIKDMIKA